MSYVFFFQAEDGIRDVAVTGVQTCALPILMMLAKEPKFDYYCWDLYAKVTNFFAEDPERAGKLRAETLKALEENRGEDAEVAQVVADAIVTCHLRSMARLDIHYEDRKSTRLNSSHGYI